MYKNKFENENQNNIQFGWFMSLNEIDSDCFALLLGWKGPTIILTFWHSIEKWTNYQTNPKTGSSNGTERTLDSFLLCFFLYVCKVLDAERLNNDLNGIMSDSNCSLWDEMNVDSLIIRIVCSLDVKWKSIPETILKKKN